MAPHIEIELPEPAWEMLRSQADRLGHEPHRLAATLLISALDEQRHSLYQVSTSGALVEGVFDGAMSVGQLREHGDFGLGTFAGLDGELIMLEGHCYRATAEGVVNEAGDDALVPFAMVTRFDADSAAFTSQPTGMAALTTAIDELRPSENVFVAIKGQASFGSLTMRAACPARDSEGLLAATKHQSEFTVEDATGTLVGFWAPDYAGAVSVPGYHFHFIDATRTVGGHVLDFDEARTDIELHVESGIHLAMPENSGFLSAELSGDHSSDLDEAETRVHGRS